MQALSRAHRTGTTCLRAGSAQLAPPSALACWCPPAWVTRAPKWAQASQRVWWAPLQGGIACIKF